jgi:P27 family predicted phage terminase small subunit
MTEPAPRKGRRGTKVPTPAALKLVEGRGNGRDSGGREVPTPPAFVRLPPTKPDGMSAIASAMWDELVDELNRLNVTKPLDAAALEMACETYARWHDARRLRFEMSIDDGTPGHGLLARNSQGLVAAPWVGIEERAAKDFRSWCQEFGLTPSAEMRLATTDPKTSGDENPFG